MDKRVEREEVPKEIDTQMDAEFDEKLVHLANISCISMRVKECRGGHGVPNIDGNDLSATTRWKPQKLDVFTARGIVQDQKASGIICN